MADQPLKPEHIPVHWLNSQNESFRRFVIHLEGEGGHNIKYFMEKPWKWQSEWVEWLKDPDNADIYEVASEEFEELHPTEAWYSREKGLDPQEEVRKRLEAERKSQKAKAEKLAERGRAAGITKGAPMAGKDISRELAALEMWHSEMEDAFSQMNTAAQADDFDGLFDALKRSQRILLSAPEGIEAFPEGNKIASYWKTKFLDTMQRMSPVARENPAFAAKLWKAVEEMNAVMANPPKRLPSTPPDVGEILPEGIQQQGVKPPKAAPSEFFDTAKQAQDEIDRISAGGLVDDADLPKYKLDPTSRPPGLSNEQWVVERLKQTVRGAPPAGSEGARELHTARYEAMKSAMAENPTKIRYQVMGKDGITSFEGGGFIYDRLTGEMAEYGANDPEFLRILQNETVGFSTDPALKGRPGAGRTRELGKAVRGAQLTPEQMRMTPEAQARQLAAKHALERAEDLKPRPGPLQQPFKSASRAAESLGIRFPESFAESDKLEMDPSETLMEAERPGSYDEPRMSGRRRGYRSIGVAAAGFEDDPFRWILTGDRGDIKTWFEDAPHWYSGMTWDDVKDLSTEEMRKRVINAFLEQQGSNLAPSGQIHQVPEIAEEMAEKLRKSPRPTTGDIGEEGIDFMVNSRAFERMVNAAKEAGIQLGDEVLGVAKALGKVGLKVAGPIGVGLTGYEVGKGIQEEDPARAMYALGPGLPGGGAYIAGMGTEAEAAPEEMDEGITRDIRAPLPVTSYEGKLEAQKGRHEQVAEWMGEGVPMEEIRRRVSAGALAREEEAPPGPSIRSAE